MYAIPICFFQYIRHFPHYPYNSVHSGNCRFVLLSVGRGESLLLYAGSSSATTISGRLLNRIGMMLFPRPRLTVMVVFSSVN